MAVGDLITATRYNALQTRVESILGNGSGTEGYGQTTASNQVVVTNTVTASHVNQLKTDVDRINRHQTNQAAGTIASITIGDMIADETSDNPNATLKGFVVYEQSMNTLETSPNRYRLSPLQSTSTSDPDTLTRTTQWNQVLNGYFRVVFTSADARRHFFNAGGTITFVTGLTSSATGGNVAKTNDWSTMLSNAGTVSFGYNYTSTSNSGTGTAIGNFQLTASEQQVFRKTGSGVYADNNYYIRAKEVNTTTIEFRIWMDEADTGNTSSAKGVAPIDEFVVGTLTTTIGSVRASGSYVDTPIPALNRQANFTGS
jgi:hypothetical protein